MNLRFRPVSGRPATGPNSDAVAVKINKGDTIRVMGFTQDFFVEEAGMKILRLHEVLRPEKKMTSFRKDSIKVSYNG